MFIEQKMYDLLVANATVSGYVGTRIYPVIGQQQGTTPYIVYTLVSSETFPTQQLGLSPLRKWSFQYSIFGTSYLQCKQIAEALKAVLIGQVFTGVGSILLKMERTLPEGEESKLHHRAVEIDVMESLT